MMSFWYRFHAGFVEVLVQVADKQDISETRKKPAWKQHQNDITNLVMSFWWSNCFPEESCLKFGTFGDVVFTQVSRRFHAGCWQARTCQNLQETCTKPPGKRHHQKMLVLMVFFFTEPYVVRNLQKPALLRGFAINPWSNLRGQKAAQKWHNLIEKPALNRRVYFRTCDINYVQTIRKNWIFVVSLVGDFGFGIRK